MGCALAIAPAAEARSSLANGCYTAAPLSGRFFFKATGLGTYMLSDTDGRLLTSDGRTDTPGPAAEWAARRRRDGRVRLRPAAGGDAIVVRLRRAGGCKPYPEAELNASGRPKRGRLVGFADAHVHVTADLRAGGNVISGTNFDRFGITQALGRDEQAHGPDGSLDVTGNLLRSGTPVGTHDVHGWPTFAGWPTSDTYTHQQIYYRWLERTWLAGERLIVAQTIEDAPLCEIEPLRTHSCDEADTVELQVRRLHALQDYVDAQSGGRGRGWFRLVTTPTAARRVIRAGKLAVLVGVESSDPFGCRLLNGQSQCDRDDIDRGIERMYALGVRTMFVAHWVDNALAGAALEGGDKGTFISAMQLSYTGRPFTTGPCPHPGQGEEPVGGLPLGKQCNTLGLSDLGAYAVRRMMDRHMLVEVDHLSERAREQVLSIAEERHAPLVSSHTGTGGVWDPSELRRLFALGGFATATIDGAPALARKVVAFGRPVGLGTDTGGFNALPGPDPQAKLRYPFQCYLGDVKLDRQRTGTKTFDLNTDGVAHYGLLADLLAQVQREPQGAEAMKLLFGSAEAYLRTWDRAVAGTSS